MGHNQLQEEFRNRKLFTQITGKGIAGSSDEIHQLLKILATGRGLSRLGTLPPLKKWMKYYRQHRLLQREIESIITGEDGTFYETMGRGLRDFDKLSRDEKIAQIKEELAKPETKTVFIEMTKAWQDLSAEMDADFAGDTASDPEIDYLIKSPAGQFFIRVWIPCLVLHRDYPTNLYRQARQGNICAIVDLIRLDKGIVSDPCISQYIYQWGHSSNRSIAQKIARAMQEWPKALSRKRLKYRLASMVKTIAKIAGDPFSNPQLQSMLDAVVETKTHGKELIDSDLPIDPESFSRRMRDEKGKWHNIIEPDKN